MSEPPFSLPETFPFRRGRPPVVLHETGFRHPGGLFVGGELFTAYPSITQLVLTVRGVRVATRKGIFLLRRDAFESAEGPELLVRALYARILAQPGGALQLARMQRLDRWMRGPNPRWLSRGVALACVLVFVIQGLCSPWIEFAGIFNADLVALGEWWRLVTANFLHAIPYPFHRFPFPSHLILNTICLLALGLLVERSLGSGRAALVMAASALGAMGGSQLAGYQWALGASGIVAGLVGGLIWLEFRRPEQLPAIWRIPRRLFVAAVVGEAVFLLFVPGIAHAAHLGGFLAGAVATSALIPAELGPGKSPRWLTPACGAVALGVFAAFVAAVWPLVLPNSAVAERRAAHLLSADIEPLHLNNVAWLILTGAAPSSGMIDVALQLAERAVEETWQRDPTILDTLAEAYFLAGRSEEAVDVIDEAIVLAPGVDYYREQRRRFTGERDAQDRPDPPPEPWQPRVPPPSPPPSPSREEPGIRV
jgi:membrane associated rhomboid family serine protease